MANVKNFGLIGVGSELQFGKGSSKLVNNAGAFSFRNAADNENVALTAAGITSSAGNVTLTTGNLVLSDNAGTVGIGGATLSRQGAGVLKFDGTAATMLPAGTTAQQPTGSVGMIRVNNDTPSASTVEYYNGSAWTTLATGGSTGTLATEIQTIRDSLGSTVDNTTGTYNPTALSTTYSALYGTSGLGGTNTSLTAALLNLGAYVTANNTLDEIFPGNNGDVIYNVGGNWQHAAPGATSGVQGYDAGLAALAAKTTTGILVQTGNDTYESRSLVQPTEGITITNADGVAGNPTFALANDLAGLEALSTTGYSVRTGNGTWTTRTFTGAAGQISITDGDGVASNTDIGLATVTQASSGNFVKVTLDTYGRVTGNTAVTTADITALVDATYVNVSGDTMTGNLVMSTGATVTGLPNPVNGTDAANKNYVDNAVSGMTWKAAVNVMSTTNVPLSGTALVIDGDTIDDGYRILLIGQTTATENGIYVASIPTPGGAYTLSRSADADTYQELIGATVFVLEGTTYANTGWVQSNHYLTSFAGQTWVQFSGAGAYTGGNGISVVGNTISAKVGTTGTALGFDGSGNIKVQTTTGNAVQINGSNEVGLVLASGSGLAQSASGLTINTASVTNAMLQNPSITLNADSGSETLSLGGTLKIQGDGGAITTAVAATDTYTISVATATSAVKGVASFNATDFTVTAGAVNLNTVGTDHGGTGLTSFAANQVFFAGTTSTMNQSADFQFQHLGTNAIPTITLGAGTIAGGTSGLPDFTITSGTNGDISLVPQGTGSVVIMGGVGNSLIESDVATALTVRGNTTLTLTSGTGSTTMALPTGTTAKVTVSGPSAADYATGLANADLVNKYYVDTAIASGAAAGSIKAVKVAVGANGVTNIGAAMPAGATVLSVKVQVASANATASIEVGNATTASAYMTAAENDPSTAGIYLAETFVTEALSTQVKATVSGSTGTDGVYNIIVEYQVAE